MRVLVAGASGAIGRPLLPLLVATGHEVTGTTRSESRAESIREAGAEAAVVDVTNLDAMRRAVHAARPEVVVNELTSFPAKFDPRDQAALAEHNHLRAEVGPALAETAADAGASRLITQSVAFFYAPEGERVKSEDDALMRPDADSAFAPTVEAARRLEAATLETPGLEGMALRYGHFYGPGTHYATDGSLAEQVRRRRFPVVGEGSGVFSFIHVDDAATATAAAVERGGPGVYNVCDDEPAPIAEWLPDYAEALGADPPHRVPSWLARPFAGSEGTEMATALRGASNAKAKRELGWQPRYASWRRGFREALG